MVKQGDIVYMDFDPHSGHEQGGRRPALVVSADIFNRMMNIRLVCPITHTSQRLPFHVRLDGRTKTDGYILCSQVKSLDIESRNYQYVETVPCDILDEALDILKGMLE